MGYSDWVSACVAVVIGLATAVIGIFQIRLGRRQDRFMREQSTLMREQSEISRRDARVVAEQAAATFIRDNYEQRGLVPLAAMAGLYGSERPYSRQLYRDFLFLSPLAQDSVFARLGFVRPTGVVGDRSFWVLLVDVLDRTYRSFFSGRTMLHNQGKYLERAFTVYGGRSIPSDWDIDLPDEVVSVRPNIDTDHPLARLVGPKNITHIGSADELTNAVTDVLAAAFEGRVDAPIELMHGTLMPATSSIETSYSDCVVFAYFAIYAARRLRDPDVEIPEYGSPGAWAGERLETMEDVFLWAVFEIYTNLVLPEYEKNKETPTP